jgi:VanZ family protein
MAAIYIESSIAGVSLPARVSDKAAHAALYAVLSSLIIWALTDGDWRCVTWKTVGSATVASILYGWTDEFHQLFVPSRQYEWLDLLADATGAFVAASLLWAWGIIRRGSDPKHGL